MSPVQIARVGIPGSLLAAGVVLLFIPDEYANGAGVVLIGSAVLVALANGLLRFSVAEMRDRDREQAARDYYGAHGRWPDDLEREEQADADARRPAADPHDVRHVAPPGHPGVEARPLEGRAGRARRSRRPPRRPEA